MAITSGILQGCPLVPLVVIVALDVLYRRLEQSADISGVRIYSDTEVLVVGYADDTAVYL